MTFRVLPFLKLVHRRAILSKLPVDSFSLRLSSSAEVPSASPLLTYSSPLDKNSHESLVDEADFERVAANYESYDTLREVVIKTSRDINKGSKKAIFALHRRDVKGARKKLKDVDGLLDELAPVFRQYPRLKEEKDFRNSLEELAEAICFCHFIERGRLITFHEINAKRFFSSEEYVAGVCDFTGELGRYAVHCSIARDFDDVVTAYHLLDQIYGQLLNFDFRNRSGSSGDLRWKFDQIKWTLKKVEQLVCDNAAQST